MTSKKSQSVDFNKRILHPEFDAATKCLHELLDEVMMDVAFDVHWAQKTGITCSLNETVDADAAKVNVASNPQVPCPVCRQSVGGVRFAPHLEKCLNGGQRVSGKRARGAGVGRLSGEQDPQVLTQLLADGIDPSLLFEGRSSGRRTGSKAEIAPKPPKRKYIYGSMVVRIRFKDGVPLPNSKRETVSFSTFHLRRRAREAREKEALEAAAGSSSTDQPSDKAPIE
mmetsp:Transcript_17772/g.29713  ORF Transcript_17772/g.29713 Transcript_17772/m.29713 type:complete len:226 (-) Transcript_17772:26-703(-)